MGATIGLLLIGVCSAFNFIVLIKKWRLKRYFDCAFDTMCMIFIAYLFSGTFSALAVGMIASMALSVYLYFHPLTLREVISDDEDEWEEEYD